MFQDAFIKLDRKECETVLKEVNPVLKGGDFDPSTATVLSQDLSFYPGYRFLDIANYESTPHFRKFVIYKPGDPVVLDWTNKPIYELNSKVPLGLAVETAAEYVLFFFNNVRGPHGKFTIVENVDDIQWREEPPPAARKAVGSMIQPVTIAGRNDDGSFRLSACMTFKNTLYKTAVFVDKSGHITTSEEEILIDDLPLLDDTLDQ